MTEQLSPIYVAQQLRQRDLFYFTPSLLADLFRLDKRRAYRLIAQLKDKALITEVEKGKYLLLGLEPERVLSNPLFIASHLIAPAYVSYWSALHVYGFTEQVPLTTFVATTKKKRPRDLPIQREAKRLVSRFSLPLHHGQAARFVRHLAAAEAKREALEKAMENVRTDWERDLRPLLPQFVPYEVAREPMEALLL